MKSYKSDFTKRHQKKIATKIVTLVGGIVIASLVIISYLGSVSGNYTIRLNRDDRQLSIADNLEFKNATSRLRAEQIDSSYPCTIDELPSDEELDKDNSASHNGLSGFDNGTYLAYTFYLKNVGTTPLSYNVKVDIESMIISSPSNTLGLDELLRVMIYENVVNFTSDGEAYSNHDKKIYAKKVSSADRIVTDENNSIITDAECVSRYNGEQTVCLGSRAPERAINFQEGTTIINYLNSISENQIIRYTVVMWLEGEDPDCAGIAPVGAGITLSMNISQEGE